MSLLASWDETVAQAVGLCAGCANREGAPLHVWGASGEHETAEVFCDAEGGWTAARQKCDSFVPLKTEEDFTHEYRH